jgi:hypothetical protein
MKPGAAIPLSLLLLAGCARSEDASVAADTNEMPQVEQVRSPEQDDEELALGEWRDTLQDDNSALEFGPTGAPALFSLRCDPRRSINLQRHGSAPARDLPTMLVSIGSETRRLAVTSVGGAVPMLRASLSPSDTLVGTLANASEPIIVRVGDTPPLVLPPGPAIGGFLNRCASGARLTGADVQATSAAEGNSAAAEGNESAPAER